MTRPAHMNNNDVFCSEPPPCGHGQERRHMRVDGTEDRYEALARAKRFAWHVAIVAGPWKAKDWWLFTVETEKLPSGA